MSSAPPFSSPALPLRHALSSSSSSSTSSGSAVSLPASASTAAAPSAHRPPDLTSALKPTRYGTSYSHLLPSSSSSSTSPCPSEALQPMEAAAPPLALDDPTLTAHRHRVILAMAGLRSSVISFVRGKQLKRELNEQFRLTHEWLHPSMSLSKLRRCKLLLLTAGADADLELSTVALSYVYLERLCWRNVVEKRNRKLLAAVCLTLAYKYNEGAQLAQRRQQLNTLFTSLERVLEVKRNEVLKHELYGWVALDFDLSVSPAGLLPHFQQLLSKTDSEVAAQYQQMQWSTEG